MRFIFGAMRHGGRGAVLGIATYMRDTLPWYLCSGYDVQPRDLSKELHWPDQRRGYIIVAPAFNIRSAGKHCLYLLCDHLNRLGYPSYITGSESTATDLNAPLLRWKDARKAVGSGRFVAIYPEIVAGNPLQAATVARWVLNRPGALGGDAVYDRGEQVFYYSNALKPHIQNGVAGKLLLPMLDESIFYPAEQLPAERPLECFYLGKSKWQDGYVDRHQAFEITRTSPAREDLGKLFRASKRLYVFDNLTALVAEALMCGCPVVIIPDGSFDRRILQESEFGAEGVAWGLDDPHATPPRPDFFLQRLQALRLEFEQQLLKFVETTQNKAIEPCANE